MGRYDALIRRASPLNHLAFRIDAADYAAEPARLTELGLEPTEAAFPNVRARAIFFRDPEQSRLELICHDGG